jgi:hypothetical protein
MGKANSAQMAVTNGALLNCASESRLGCSLKRQAMGGAPLAIEMSLRSQLVAFSVLSTTVSGESPMQSLSFGSVTICRLLVIDVLQFKWT